MVGSFRRLKVAVAVLAFGSASLAPSVLTATPASAAAPTCVSTTTKWTGAISTDWGTAGNWSAGVPTAGQTACIQTSATRQPTIGSGTTTNFLALTAETGTTLTVTGTGSLTTNADSDFQNLSITAGGTYIQSGSGSSTAKGNFLFEEGSLNGTNALGVLGTTTFSTAGTKTIAQHFIPIGATTWSAGNITSPSGVGIENRGAWDTTATGNVTLTINNQFENIAGASFTHSGSGTLTMASNLVNPASATVASTGGLITFTGTRTITNAGTIQASTGNIDFGTNAYAQSASTSVLTTGTGHTITAPSFAISNGAVNGVGTLIGNVTVSGGSIGAATAGTVGTLAITGNYSQSAGALLVDVTADASVPSASDALQVSGTASLSGSATLSIDTPSFTPDPNGSSFAKVITGASSRSGTFATVTDDLLAGQDWAPQYLTTGVVATYGAAAPYVCLGTEDTKWTGASSTDWNTAGNWSNGIPNSGKVACVATTATRQPTISTTVPTLNRITAEAGTTLTIATGGTLTTTTPTSYFQNLVLSGGQLNVAGLTNKGDVTFNAGAVTSTSGWGIVGTFTVATNTTKTFSGALFTAGPTDYQDGTLAVSGSLTNTTTGVFTANPATSASVLVTGTITNNGIFRKIGSGSFALTGAVSNGAGSALRSEAGTLAIDGNITNAGLVIADAGTIDLGGHTFTQSAASTALEVVNGGRAYATSFAISNGTLRGSGRLIGNVTISGGLVTPGTAGTVGTLTIDGDYTQSGGVLRADITGPYNAPPTPYDSIKVAGPITLSGTASLDLVTPGFDPNPAGYSLANVLTTSTSRTGTFATVTDDLGLGQDWTITYDTVAVRAKFGTVPVGFRDPASKGTGYWLLGSDAKIYGLGSAVNYGDPSKLGRLNAPVVGLAETPSGNGYLAVATDGGVFTFGDATFAGSTGSLKLNQPMVDIAANPAGTGYWTAAADGGVFTFGDAQFFGSTANLRLNAPIKKIVPTPTGQGYWLLGTDGGVFSFGDASFFGSTGSLKLNAPIVDIAVAQDGTGYWLIAADGGVFSFGPQFYGSTGSLKLNAPIVSARAVGDAKGYYLFAADGGVFTFGTATFTGTPGASLTGRIVN